jgi:hypothetical protein
MKRRVFEATPFKGIRRSRKEELFVPSLNFQKQIPALFVPILGADARVAARAVTSAAKQRVEKRE